MDRITRQVIGLRAVTLGQRAGEAPYPLYVLE
jgi:hypothetical protein